ncbi:SDR family NAD(P)-dependent oxidoreductase [Coxiella-like endosymbiont of Rhipicephalus sanguineus]|uniref:SDR family NAD(P)-dependent oxidoreductase n=1 Tax=Coxiella-like endosymbiont of Rhipicephalus sanguineus TaxID=1955402 RepID=UPI00203CF9D4|nr:SDR family NAD(P)-dependent oxidoreductase [Coxiella-like endosymbiont of Rhipicephalus sanguineus]
MQGTEIEIKNQVVVITGSGSGISAETARFLYQQRAKIALLDKQFNRAKVLADELNGLAIECDVSHAQSTKQAIEAVINEFRALLSALTM